MAANRVEENAFDEKDIRILEQFAPVVAEGVRRLRDLSELAEREQQLRQAQTLESLGLLAGGIAHDFNNMLTGVILNLSLLENMLDKESAAYEITEESKQAVDRTRDLTQQLLTFAQGGVPIKKPAAIAELIRDTTALSLSGSNTKAEYHLTESLHSVQIDPGQIGQVIQNLVLNADQAMPEGGILQGTAENVEISERDRLPITAGNYIKISVVDQGIGMSAEVMAKIFDPYYTTKSAGHGRGLSVSHSIIQKHDGHIAVRSEQNVGTTFEFYLPTTLENPTTTTAPDREIAHGSGRILLMDDDKMILIAMMRGLEILGYEVESVYDGAATLQAYKTSVDEGKAYDIVIVDLTVPGTMGGQITAAKLHEIDPQLRIIVYSGYANNPVMANYEDYGFVDNLTKPIDIQELAQTTKRVMDMTDRGVMS